MGNSLVGFGTNALLQECHHITPSIPHAVAYGFGAASAFVGALYVLVPAHVRQLDRDDPLQIKWRTFATATACMLTIALYPYNFCRNEDQDLVPLTTTTTNDNQPVLQLVGIFSQGGAKILLGTLAHSMVLYIGPIFMLLLQVHLIARNSRNSNFARVFWEVYIQPQISILTNPHGKVEKWILIRSVLAAPTMEEVVFRGCIVPPLLRTGTFHAWTIAWIAPAFFGLAHCHHAFLKLKQGEPIQRVLLTTIFQFLYTTLFGAYAAHAFIRSRSIVAVILSHSFCNSMGLPSLQFLSQSSPFYQYRIILMVAHILGLIGFIWGFTTSLFLPFPGENNGD